MKIDPTKVYNISILRSDRLNKKNPLLFNNVLEVIEKVNGTSATINTGIGRIEIPAATNEVLDKLKKIGVNYKVIL